MSRSVSSPDSSQIAAANRDRAHLLVESLIDECPGSGFSAHEVLDRHPHLRSYRSCVVDLAYEEYCRAREFGEPVAASEFVEAFSTVRESLYRVIEFDQVLREHPSLVEEIPEERWPRSGDRFLGFDFLEQLGRGALSRVFLARHNKLGRKHVVVKVCVRGEREADLLGKLEHPNIGEVHSIDIDAGTGLAAICMPFQTRFTMHHVAEWMTSLDECETFGRVSARQIADKVGLESELVEIAVGSQTLASAFLDDDTAGDVIVKWGVQLSDALGKAHSNGVLHCDVKPGNVLILPDLSARLLDFNLASSAAETQRIGGGTLPYMAPEQLNFINAADTDRSADAACDADGTDERSDVFGLCATLWHMSTGTPPFGSVADSRTRLEAVEEMLGRISAGVESAQIEQASLVLPPPMVQSLLKGMSYCGDDRQLTMEHLQQDFASHVRKRTKSKRLAAMGITLLLMIASVAAFTFETNRTPADPIPAATAKARQMLSDGDAAGAAELLAEFRYADDTCRILDLTARTYCLKNLDHHALMADNYRDENYLQWESVLADWNLASEASSWRETCQLNAYLVQLEMTVDATPAFELLAKMPSIMSNPQFEPRRQRLLKVHTLQQDNSFENTSLISELVDSVDEGTRGEFIALFRMAFLEQHNHLSQLGGENLDRMLMRLAAEPPIAEPGLASYWLQRRQNGLDPALKMEAINLQAQEKPVIPNSLWHHLLLPPDSKRQ